MIQAYGGIILEQDTGGSLLNEFKQHSLQTVYTTFHTIQ